MSKIFKSFQLKLNTETIKVLIIIVLTVLLAVSVAALVIKSAKTEPKNTQLISPLSGEE